MHPRGPSWIRFLCLAPGFQNSTMFFNGLQVPAMCQRLEETVVEIKEDGQCLLALYLCWETVLTSISLASLNGLDLQGCTPTSPNLFSVVRLEPRSLYTTGRCLASQLQFQPLTQSLASFRQKCPSSVMPAHTLCTLMFPMVVALHWLQNEWTWCRAGESGWRI